MNRVIKLLVKEIQYGKGGNKFIVSLADNPSNTTQKEIIVDSPNEVILSVTDMVSEVFTQWGFQLPLNNTPMFEPKTLNPVLGERNITDIVSDDDVPVKVPIKNKDVKLPIKTKAPELKEKEVFKKKKMIKAEPEPEPEPKKSWFKSRMKSIRLVGSSPKPRSMACPNCDETIPPGESICTNCGYDTYVYDEEDDEENWDGYDEENDDFEDDE